MNSLDHTFKLPPIKFEMMCQALVNYLTTHQKKYILIIGDHGLQILDRVRELINNLPIDQRPPLWTNNRRKISNQKGVWLIRGYEENLIKGSTIHVVLIADDTPAEVKERIMTSIAPCLSETSEGLFCFTVPETPKHEMNSELGFSRIGEGNV